MNLPVLNPVLNCDDCGACCRYMGAVPINLLDRSKEGYGGPMPGNKPLPEWLEAELWAVHESIVRGGPSMNDQPCIWYDTETRRCRHYEFRPEVCSEFEVGGEDCLRIRAEYKIS
jgi:Fe-S-cluster containining protein